MKNRDKTKRKWEALNLPLLVRVTGVEHFKSAKILQIEKKKNVIY